MHNQLPFKFQLIKIFRLLVLIFIYFNFSLVSVYPVGNRLSIKPDNTKNSDDPNQDLFDSLLRSATIVLYFSPDSARSIAINALEKLHDNHVDTRIRFLNLIGTSHHLQANYADALSYYHDALLFAIQLKDSTRTANILNNIGIAHLNTGNYKDAYGFFLNALDKYILLGQLRNISSTRNNIGLLFRELNNSERALENFSLALEGFTQAKDSIGITAALNNIGSVYALDEHLKEAYSYFEEASCLAIASGNSFGLSVAHQGIATVYQKQDSLAKAIFHFRKSISIADKINQPFVKANAFIGLSKVFMEEGDYEKAFPYAEQALQIALKIQNKVLKYECYNTLSQVHELSGNYRESLNFHKRYHQLKEELLNQSIVHQVHNLELSSLNETNQFQQLELERKELAISKKNNLLWFTSIIFALIITGFYFFYHNHRNRQRVKFQQTVIELTEKKSLASLEAEIQERKRIGQELHDGLGQLLSVAGLNVSVLQKKKKIPEQKREELLNAVMRSIDEAFSEVRNISHNLAPSLLSERGLNGALKSLSDQVNQSKQLLISFETFGLESKIESLIENTLFRAIQEILNNTIKHSNASKLQFQIARGDNEITLMAEDNGIGFDINQLSKNTGHGLSNMKTRIENLNGNVYVDSNPSRGTIISIVLPIKTINNVKRSHQSIGS